jgi:regulator of CtrA degradation
LAPRTDGNYVLIFGRRALDRLTPPGQCFVRRLSSGPAQNKKIFVAFEAYSMSERSANEAGPVSFGQRLASSQQFTGLFRDGMALVEETASYLDGPGRQESKKLARTAALAYATESMRLTTRLMQLASWLLLHRAVKEGEMSLAQAGKEKAKVKLSVGELSDEDNIKLVPEQLRRLIERSKALQLAIRRLDATMHATVDPARIRTGNPVERQLGMLKAAFED